MARAITSTHTYSVYIFFETIYSVYYVRGKCPHKHGVVWLCTGAIIWWGWMGDQKISIRLMIDISMRLKIVQHINHIRSS